jgi:hypothetical protein
VAIVYSACIIGSLIDETAGTPLIEAPEITVTAPPGIGVNLAPGGLFALVCYADIILPKLATTAYNVTFTLAAADFRSQTVTATIPAGAALPFTLPPIPLRPLTVRLQGRVVKDADRTAIAGAAVNVTSANVIALRSPAYFDHASGIAIDAVTLAPSGAATSLASSAEGGAITLTLASTAGLAAGQILQIGPDLNADFAAIAAMGPGAAQVSLANAINSTIPAGATVQPVSATPSGGSSALTRDANSGDGLLLVSGSLSSPVIRITDGAQTEYHLTGALTDANGYYFFNGIGGVQTLDLTSGAAGFSNLTRTVAVSWNNPANLVDFRLKP